MEFIKLHITLISCEDLTCPITNKPIKKDAMAIIRTPPPAAGHVFSTTLDKNNGSYPCWNEKFRVDMPVNAKRFDVEIRHGMDSVIGVARVQVSDFINNLVPVGYLNFLSYRLGGHEGFLRGIVNISVRVIPNDDQYCSYSKDKISLGRPVSSDSSCSGSVISQFGYGGLSDHSGNGVVTGIPVSYGVNKMM